MTRAAAARWKTLKGPSHLGIGLQELPEEALEAIESGEDVEAIAGRRERPAPQPQEEAQGEERHGDGFIELDRMAGDAVAEIDGPGQVRGRAIGIVGKPGQEAADAPDGDRHRQRQDQDRPGRTPYAEDAFVDLRHDDAADNGAQDAASLPRHPGERHIQAAEPIGAGDGAQPEHQEIDRVAPPRHGQRHRREFMPARPPAHGQRRRPGQALEQAMEARRGHGPTIASRQALRLAEAGRLALG